MPGPRDYTRRTIITLAHCSGGLCYYPGCPEPVLREVNGELYPIFEIAHIRGAYPNSRRFDASMTDDQRRDVRNLLLLCHPHHQEVDSEDKEEIYTPEVLRRWKSQRESDPREALKRLREVSPSALREIVADGIAQHDAKLLSALGRLEANDRDAAVLMRGLVDELTEAYAHMREIIPSEILEEFVMAVGTLSRLEETLENFNHATYRLREYGEFKDY